MTTAPPVRRYKQTCAAAALAASLVVGAASAQTVITPPPNDFLPAEDVRLGEDAAAIARGHLRLLTDTQVNRYVGEVATRLVEAIPTELRQPGFLYSFDVLDIDYLNAFGLPGGPVYITRSFIEAAGTEAELAGVIAHVIAHVVLRHGTAQLTAADKFQFGEIAAESLGTAVSAPRLGIMAQGVNFGLSTYFLKYHPDHERQADILAAHLMARAGYDPTHLASAYRTIATAGVGRGGPQWMSSHPDFGGRDDTILLEAATLRIEGSPVTGRLAAIQTRLRSMPPAPTLDEISCAHGSVNVATTRSIVRLPLPVPAGQYRSVTAGDVILMSVPVNWVRVPRGNTVTFAPEGAFFESEDATEFTHGIQIGVARSLTGDLEGDMQALLLSFGEANPHLRWVPAYRRVTIGGRKGVTTTLHNVSAYTRNFETVSASAAHLSDGTLLYVIGIAPQDEAGLYRKAFDQVLGSIQLAD